MRQTGITGRALVAARVDLRPGSRPPSTVLVAVATVIALAASLGSDALLVRAGTSVFPSTAGYTHFRFSDYSELTVIGVVAAGVAWPLVTRITTAARWLFLRLAVVVSAVLLLPDVWLLATGQPAEAVAVLVALHLAIAVITYHALVQLAPVGAPRDISAPTADPFPTPPGALRRPLGRAAWGAMVALIAVETGFGIAALVVVPVGRPNGAVPTTGEGVYVVHAVVGMVLGLGAALLLLRHLGGARLYFTSALVGFLGVALGAVGGVLAVYKPERFLGIGLMLVGALAAGFAYLTPIGFAEDDLPAAAVAGFDSREWDDDEGQLACVKRHPTATETRHRRAPDLDAEAWAAVCLAAGTCPICADKRLRPIGGNWICGCCETIYRELPDDGDGTAWAATPGRRVTRR
jgi:hypothetical protein